MNPIVSAFVKAFIGSTSKSAEKRDASAPASGATRTAVIAAAVVSAGGHAAAAACGIYPVVAGILGGPEACEYLGQQVSWFGLGLVTAVGTFLIDGARRVVADFRS